MKLLLFGQIGSGKTHLATLLTREHGLHHRDADDDLPPEIVAAIRRHEPFTDAMRDAFVERIRLRIAALVEIHPRFVVSQALFRERHRALLRAAYPELVFVWVRSTPDLIATRLRDRTGHVASAYYAKIINPGFETPRIPHYTVENLGEPARLRRDLSELMAKLTTASTEAPALGSPP